MAEKDQEFVEMIVKEIVDHPDDAKVERTVDDRGVLLTLSTNPEDMGKIIGKDGKTAEALRTLLRIIGAKNNARVNLKILEPEGSERTPRADKPPREDKPVKEEKPAKEKEPLEMPEPETQPIEEEKATEII
jgi:predicted RNA-binding protein YlqC (UPF0109 family)